MPKLALPLLIIIIPPPLLRDASNVADAADRGMDEYDRYMLRTCVGLVDRASCPPTTIIDR
jgi:hypothetical protein